MPTRPNQGDFNRRQFLQLSGAAALGAALSGTGLSLQWLQPIPVIGNPLETYPARDWEKVYREQYRFDRTFTFVCAPNDTHNCRLRAYVRNGIVVRTEQDYNVHNYQDLYGNKATRAWNPRGCLKGYTVMRRVYGPFRVKYPLVRRGFKRWVEAGFPRQSNGLPLREYFHRGQDAWERASWEEAQTLMARALLNIMGAYQGHAGAARLHAQGYPPEMMEAMHGAGPRVVKCRAGMWLTGIPQIGTLYRFANMLALFDESEAKRQGREPLGARAWSNYDWHGDLPPGHPMVTGIQTFDPDLDDFRRAKLLIFMGKNMVENKMADAHWWVEVMERGGKIVNISPEYSPASTKADYWIPIRPGTDTAFLLGLTHILLRDRAYDADFVKRFTDLPLLVRLDTLKLLRARDLFPNYQHPAWNGYSVQVQKIDPKFREAWGDFLVWDEKTAKPVPLTREDVGDRFLGKQVSPALEGSFSVGLPDGNQVQVKTVFQLYKELVAEYNPATVAEICQTPVELLEQLSTDLATLKPAMLHTGEGVNHYFHCDLTTRAVFLPMALTGNIGKPGGNVGHWAGNYKTCVFDGIPKFITEDPFQMNLDPNADIKDVHSAYRLKPENVCYWNYEDRPLIVATPQGRKVFTGTSHMPTPTKVIWAANVNLLNNAKWAYNMVANVDPKVELIAYNEIEWTGSCEYADIVFPAQSWMELEQPSMTASCSNPFLQVWKGGIKPLYDSRPDGLIVAGVAAALSRLSGDARYRDFFKFYLDNRSEVYIQRILDASTTTRGYKVNDLLASDRGWLMLFRTTPRITGWEQIHESKPFYNRTGRLEFYREEDEFIEYGENLIVHREPVEATPYLPNVIVASHPALRPNDYGLPADSLDAGVRQVRNLKKPWSDVKRTSNPLWQQGFRFYCLTPKTRHRVHSSWSVCDWNLLWDSNFADPYREDKRTPWVGEHQMQINPDDARQLGINDGDYVWVDANPADRPYVGWKPGDPFYKVSRLLLRAKYNPAYPRGVTMIKHGPFMATHKSVRAHETRADGRARAADTGYQANLRYGSQQSLTRGWLQPTQMTDSLVRKEMYGQRIGEGYAPDIHSPNTCPKETLVKITKAEDGAVGGKGVWEPASSGYTPGRENEAMQRYLKGEFIEED
jgi:nitrate reductase alpha subunit